MELRVDPLFGDHALNAAARQNVAAIGHAFTVLAEGLMPLVADPRSMALVRTHLQEAFFYARQGVALAAGNQEPAGEPHGQG